MTTNWEDVVYTSYDDALDLVKIKLDTDLKDAARGLQELSHAMARSFDLDILSVFSLLVRDTYSVIALPYHVEATRWAVDIERRQSQVRDFLTPDVRKLISSDLSDMKTQAFRNACIEASLCTPATVVNLQPAFFPDLSIDDFVNRDFFNELRGFIALCPGYTGPTS